MTGNVAPASLSDGELIRRAQLGDREAFGELYQRYLAPIYGYIRLRVESERDAEDLTEMVFMKSLESLGRYEDRGAPFAAFLYKVARHLVIDSYRSKPAPLPLEVAEARPDSEPGTETNLVERERGRAALSAMARLSEPHQEVIRLRVLLGLPTETAAQWMGRSPAAIRVLLHRALRTLRKVVESNDVT